ncbi:MAG: TetR/AcrR family transcriptional regulator [Actinomycetota bacterium]
MTKRDALVEATKELVSQHGYRAVSPRMILDESGAGQGSLYHHFAGKVDLAGTALDQLSTEMCTEFDVEMSRHPDPMDQLSTYLALERDALGGCRVGRLAHEDAIGMPEIRDPVARYFNHVEQGLLGAATRAAEEGHLRPGIDPGDVAAALVAAVQGGYVIARVHKDPDAMTRALRGAEALLRDLESDTDDREG